ncbi:MAG: serine/threonine protein kinase [Lachnospiraceae bacterium]|nr:serine/threonine protein kinase [Lachnospiraceae bacterium]
MDLAEKLRNFIQRRRNARDDANGWYWGDSCPRCEANLTLQKGFETSLPYWICQGCHQMLINPNLEQESDIVWICDGCGGYLNLQEGFSESCGTWKCTECGFENEINAKMIFASEDERQATQRNPYLGLSVTDVQKVLTYVSMGEVGSSENVIRVRNCETGDIKIKKLLKTYDRSIFDYLLQHPVPGMPQVEELYESRNCLIVIEEYVEGCTLESLLACGPISYDRSIVIAKEICRILDALHNIETPIIHRDVKPANIIIRPDGSVCLLDMNVAKWYDPDDTDDTRHLGTRDYAAPEQAGFGLSGSTTKSDIYALGILLNVMLTGQLPKARRAEGPVWDIIERCIRLNAEERFTAGELAQALEKLTENSVC